MRVMGESAVQKAREAAESRTSVQLFGSAFLISSITIGWEVVSFHSSLKPPQGVIYADIEFDQVTM